MFSTGSKKATGRRRGGGESSGKFSSFYYCVCYAYALHKPLPPRVEPVARPVSLVRSQHMLGLYTAYAVYSMHRRSFGGVCWAGVG